MNRRSEFVEFLVCLILLMATSQSSFPSSHASQIKYDVFISFRGSDTRCGFLSHLLKALTQKNIEAYVDNKLKEGDELLPALVTAIEESQIALIIFSEDYASSTWCLKELVKIIECRMKKGQIVVPIFYKVDPSDVRHQKGCYKNAFDKHEKLLKDNILNVEKWRAALKKVASLSGFHSINFGTEAELIEVVVQRVLTRLNHMYQVDFKGLVGIDKPIADLQSLILRNISKDVHIIGIWGIGGIGKTTIAGALFSILCSEHEDCYFLANVREQSKKDGIIQLREKLLLVLLKEKYLNIDVLDGTLPAHVLRRLRRKKVLLVLDDINSLDHITSLVGGHDWFGPGSKIIVTTRDKHVLCKEADDIYEVEALGDQTSLQLLNLHAFNGKCLQINWHNLMHKVVAYAKGMPLALRVLGSFLYGKSVEEWESLLQKLQKMSFPEIQNVLRLSYEGLDREEQSIFLYIACFFHYNEVYWIKTLLDACGYSVAIALKNLQDKSLVTISFGHVSMHDLIREMGREIVREQSIENPGKRSHLWDSNNICRVLENDEGTEHIESISLNMTKPGDLSISPHAFARMDNLKFLIINNSHTDSRVHLSKGLRILPDKIRLLHWDNYPCKSFPTTFNAEYLVVLRMENSHVKKLWNSAPNLANLKGIDLRGSKRLIEVPDFSKATSLEDMDLSYCANLISVHPSIFTLQKLVQVNLAFCERLENLPAIEALPSSVRRCGKLQHLCLGGCKRLKHLHGISKLRYLRHLGLYRCKQLNTSNLHMLFDGLWSLRELCLSNCCNLYELPENISKLSYLFEFSLWGSNVKSLPESIKHLSQLRRLYLSESRRLQSLPEIPASVHTLLANDCTSLERLFTPTRELLEEHNRLSERNPNHFLFIEFSFDNCPNLDKDALDAFLAYINGIREREQDTAQIQFLRRQSKKRKEPSSGDGPSCGATVADTRVSKKGKEVAVSVLVPMIEEKLEFDDSEESEDEEEEIKYDDSESEGEEAKGYASDGPIDADYLRDENIN